MRFAIKAVDEARRVMALEIEAQDELAARDAASRRGYSVIRIERRGLLRGKVRGVRKFPTTVFSIQLLALLDAGLNVVEALQVLSHKESGREHGRELHGILQNLHRGQTLSQALGSFPEAFPPLYVATIAASERTGSLKESLARYVAYQEELDKVRKKVLGALIYPAILVTVGALVLAFLLLYVVPRFARVYEDISSDLPLFSSLLLMVGRWVDAHWLILASAMVGVAVAAALVLSSTKLRAAMLAELLGWSALAETVRVYQLARFYRTVGMLLRAGIPALRSLEMVSGLLPLSQRDQLRRAAALIEEGHAISSALTTAGLATPVATQMMAVGEKSGRMGELMDRIARFFDDETARFIDTFTRVFEPALMAVLGIAVGGIVVLMYMPIFELAGAVQ